MGPQHAEGVNGRSARGEDLVQMAAHGKVGGDGYTKDKDTFSAVCANGELSEWFETVMGVLQSCVLSPLLFNIFLEMIMAMALDGSNEEAGIGGERIGDLRFADDIALQENGLQKISRSESNNSMYLMCEGVRS